VIELESLELNLSDVLMYDEPPGLGIPEKRGLEQGMR
jgi:hypothetical protein